MDEEVMRWSFSAHGTFIRCHRMYFFRYIMSSHNAKDPVRRECFLLSQLQHTSDWMGSLAHNAIASDFVPSAESGKPLTEDMIRNHIISLAKKQYEFSVAKLYRTTTKKDASEAYCALYVHDYGIGLEKSTLMKEVDEFASTVAQNLVSQKDMIALISKSSWIRPEVNLAWKIKPDATVFGQLDVLSFSDDRKATIIDWKTGSFGSGSRNQMAVYGRLVLEKWTNLTLDDIEITEINLRHGKVITHKMNETDMLSTEDFIYQSIFDIQQVTQNHEFDSQIKRISEYSYAGSVNSCRYCSD
ncbi:hypothetical protein E4H12_06645 [Candidatus Thorarchaeota archaeon]|nr:MAG: hypothetical protein E4H12_06645 [Candidatus Thorarchaeota archaeon]